MLEYFEEDQRSFEASWEILFFHIYQYGCIKCVDVLANMDASKSVDVLANKFETIFIFFFNFFKICVQKIFYF
jgi:hypothetical protein